ncbi:MAG: VWA-like domain-containing protein [Ktedonobacterales bacterium]
MGEPEQPKSEQMTAEQCDRRTRRMVSAALTQIRRDSPFFATLALFARFHVTDALATAATDGRDIYLNADFFAALTAPQRAGLLLHEVLHAALLHVPRRCERDPLIWNIAADIVVNGVIAAAGQPPTTGQQARWSASATTPPTSPIYELPEGAVRDAEIEHLSVEEVYHIVQTDPARKPLVMRVILWDLLANGPNNRAGQLDEKWRAALEEHWRQALEQARTIAHATQHGTLPAGLDRELGAIRHAQFDWRAYLWRFLVKTPTDFQGFDRRFIGQDLYLESLDDESVHASVAVDTSGSISSQIIDDFLGEVRGILGAYPHVRCSLYYADAACYGPYDLTSGDTIPRPQGGGGTDFRPFFTAIEAAREPSQAALCVYLTDGYGSFPDADDAPDIPTLWVVTPGGLDLDKIPFGESVRLLD